MKAQRAATQSKARASSAVLYRRSRHIVGYWSARRLVLENYATGKRVNAGPAALEVLDYFHEWRMSGELCSHLAALDPVALRAAVTRLTRLGLLERSDRPQHAEEAAMEGWKAWNPAAGFFHLSTKDLPYAPESGIRRRLLKRAAERRLPPRFKHYPNAVEVRLPAPRRDGEFPSVLLSRRTWRSFSDQPIDLRMLATLLGLTWGVHGWMKLPAVARAPLKTSPSGGARHSIEVYVLALRVTGLPRGLYHYAPARHALERIASGATARTAASYLPSQSWFASAAAVMIMTSVFARVQWRYDTARAYRAVLLEAGHLCQTFCLVATWLGLAPFCTLALSDSRIEQDLAIDGITEGVLYAAGVGGRPQGIKYAGQPQSRVF